MNDGIVIKGLTKCYRDICAVNCLDLEIERGETFALLGVNGAGKTTVVKMLSCLTVPTSGDAAVGGHSTVMEKDKVKSIIGVSPQETAVAPNLTVAENLEFILGVHGVAKCVCKEKIKEISKAFSLDPVMKRKAGKLSGGWQRRLSIAMAMITDPEFLFLDEPTLGLDVIVRSELWDLIRGLKGGTTVVLTTHYMEEAEALSDRIGIMKDGVLVSVGTAEELKVKAGKDRFEDAFIEIVRGGGK